MVIFAKPIGLLATNLITRYNRVKLLCFIFNNIKDYMKQIENFIESIQNDSNPLVTGEFGRKTVAFPLQPEKSADMDGRLK